MCSLSSGTLALCLYSSGGAGGHLESRADVLSLGLKCAEGLKMMLRLPVMHISAGSVRDAIRPPCRGTLIH